MPNPRTHRGQNSIICVYTVVKDMPVGSVFNWSHIQQALKERIGMHLSQPTISKALQLMDEDGWVDRVSNRNYKRIEPVVMPAAPLNNTLERYSFEELSAEIVRRMQVK